ncbi:MAG: hypothetical protein LBC69_02650 [Eubacteriaceae bacterium]|jgi:hypothetical protein|nr:hypothetical protein [Eubacteriaceae bacterium]
MKYFIFAIVLLVAGYAAYLCFARFLVRLKAHRHYSFELLAKMYGKDELIHISRYNPDLTRRKAYFRLSQLLYDENSQVYTEAEGLLPQADPAFSDFADLVFYLGPDQASVHSASLRPFSVTRQESAVSGGRAPNRVSSKLDSSSTFVISRTGAESLSIRLEERSGF